MSRGSGYNPIPTDMSVQKFRRPDPHDPKRNRVSISQWEDAISIKDPDLSDIQRAVNDFCTMFPDIRIVVQYNRATMQGAHAAFIQFTVEYKGEAIGTFKKELTKHDYDRLGEEHFKEVFAQDFIRQLLMRGIKSVFDEMYENYKEEKEKAELDADIFDF